MKLLIAFLCLVPFVASGRVGPDLSAGVNVEFFTKLRMDYAKAPGTKFFPAWNLDPDHEEIIEAYRKGAIDEVLKLSDAWLRKCPVDADTHLRVAMCFKEKGDLAGYASHLAVFYGLLQSIVSAGDGLSVEKAFVVISVREEYSLLGEIGAKVEKQSLINGPCDKMEVSRNKGEIKSTYYFNVAIPLKAMEADLTGKE